MPELPIYQIKGRHYYRDERLNEYRAVDDPSDRITFDEFFSKGMELETPSGEVYIPLGKEAERAAQELRARAEEGTYRGCLEAVRDLAEDVRKMGPYADIDQESMLTRIDKTIERCERPPSVRERYRRRP